MAKKAVYNEESISQLKGADRVRLRPAVIFGSDGIEGCEHAVFEILSNSIDEAREGYGKEITVTRFLDGSVEVVDHGRGMPMDYNEKEKRWNWELLFCEMYAGSKYNTNNGGTYEYSLGLNGLGLVPHSMLRSTWMPRCTKTVFAMRYILRRASPSASFKRNRTIKKIPGQEYAGNRISRCSPILIFLLNTIRRLY